MNFRGCACDGHDRGEHGNEGGYVRYAMAVLGALAVGYVLLTWSMSSRTGAGVVRIRPGKPSMWRLQADRVHQGTKGS